MNLRVKVCGITSADDARAAVDAGADALGFNFYEKSPRFIELKKAAAIIQKLPPFVTPVALFVNAPGSQVREALGACRWGALQFSGDEDEDLLLSFPADLVLRTVRLKDKRGLKAALGTPRCAGLLVDAAVEGSYGGTGKLARWDLAAAIAAERTVILAGGLVPSNVAEAVKQVRPWGVDVASGVEKAPGRKDALKMREFIRAAKAALPTAD
jgi:phosphoribosylanthranilate isomerase